MSVEAGGPGEPCSRRRSIGLERRVDCDCPESTTADRTV
ncbi:hypothetical protein NJ7G_3596 [Natrinema sp. J7-2]|nr:hypothetical protein NJ7G_3596 [Natrinema sp. J7-2]